MLFQLPRSAAEGSSSKYVVQILPAVLVGAVDVGQHVVGVGVTRVCGLLEQLQSLVHISAQPQAEEVALAQLFQGAGDAEIHLMGQHIQIHGGVRFIGDLGGFGIRVTFPGDKTLKIFLRLYHVRGFSPWVLQNGICPIILVFPPLFNMGEKVPGDFNGFLERCPPGDMV